MMVGLKLTLAILLLGLQLARAYYVPGTYPQEFRVGALLSGKDLADVSISSTARLIDRLCLAANVNSLKSFDTELPFEYYTMPFCKPPGGVKRIADTANPGTILEGLRIENSPYNFTMKARCRHQDHSYHACAMQRFHRFACKLQ